MKICLASSNAGKLREFKRQLHDLGLYTLPDYPEIAETSLSFWENALSKARVAAKLCGGNALGDDSGLIVPALGGEPGLYSSRYAGAGASDAANRALLLKNMAGLERREASFYCALVLIRYPEDPCPLFAEGWWSGSIADAERGSGGFGYDSIFYLPDQGCSAAELEPEVKDKISHRGQAVSNLRHQLALRHELPQT